MVKVKTDVNGNALPCEIYLDGTEKENLDFYNKKRNLDWDVVGAVVGLEGDGKSIFTAQRALYMDHKFNVDNIVFTEYQFYEAVDDEKIILHPLAEPDARINNHLMRVYPPLFGLRYPLTEIIDNLTHEVVIQGFLLHRLGGSFDMHNNNWCLVFCCQCGHCWIEP